jgi:serine O-acetyltransferase
MSVAEVEAMLALEAPDAGGGQDPGAAKLLDANAVIRRTAMLLAERAQLDVPGLRLPEPSRVAELSELARNLLFPEVFTTNQPCAASLDDCCRRLHALLADVLLTERLARPTRDSLRPGHLGELPDLTADTWAHETATGLLERLPFLRSLMETDLQAAVDGDPAARSQAEVILCYPGFHAIATHRLAHRLWLAGAPLTARLMAEQAHHRTGIDLHPGATIGPAFFIDHGTGVVVGETAILGARVRLYQGVTVGARKVDRVQNGIVPGRKRHPTLEDDVVVYANATILGGDTIIGKGAIIGGNTWVTTSVPAGARLRLDLAARVADAVVMIPDGAQPE